MIKKQLLLTFLISLTSVFFISNYASAYYVVSENDPNSIIMAPSYDGATDTIQLNFANNRVKKITSNIYHDSSYTSLKNSKTDTSPSYFTGIGLTCVGFYHIKAFDDSGSQIAEAKIAIEEGDLVQPRCDGEGSGEEPTDQCDSCALLQCPGWGEFMGQLDEILGAIPPPPNWGNVAEIFRDTIAPKIKADLQDVIGSAPNPNLPFDLPSAPGKPSAPEKPTINKPNLKTPTGQEAEGLGDSTFTEDELKDKAPVIKEREDPTGGFDISDPIGKLPSQEEFVENVPEEGTAEIPKPPTEQENIAPQPEDTTDTAPTPSEDFGTAPTPTEDFDKPPTPTEEEDGNTAPTPSEDFGTAPIPGGDFSTAPIPGDTTGNAPIPGDNPQYTAPIP
ncbi:hypothetical protein SFC08_16815 [Lysinibacillus halotolerans]